MRKIILIILIISTIILISCTSYDRDCLRIYAEEYCEENNLSVQYPFNYRVHMSKDVSFLCVMEFDRDTGLNHGRKYFNSEEINTCRK